ncbi:hypothetical protein SAMN04488601_104156 [Paenibacillus sp. 453mf]|uniref:Uncharacterized protein n=2 Tax=Paenibacillus sp. 453mf TaxID=1761874 RepID=A0ACD6BAK4_9BACL|nr:hypothetical protein SAMN04488601_104156 [Paenibacillus sp. 453mf]
MTEASTYIGTVQDVNGANIRVVLDINTISSLKFVDGQGYRIGQIGSFVRIPIGYINLFGIVSQVGAGAVPDKLLEVEPYGHRWISVQLVGEEGIKKEFERGVSQYPTIGDKVHIVTEPDLKKIYGTQNKKYISLGNIASVDSIPALVNIDTLVTRHSAVLGSTGSGKSTTVTSILQRISDMSQFPSARIIVFDIHGEYAAAFKGKAKVYKVTPSNNELKLSIPYWALTCDEFLSVAFGGLEGSGRNALIDKIYELKLQTLKRQEYEGINEDSLTVDTPIPFSIHKLWFDLYRAEISTHYVQGSHSEENEALLLGEDGNPVQKGDSLKVVPPIYMPHTQAQGATKIYLSNRGKNIRKPLEGLASLLKDPRYEFLFNADDWSVNLDGKTNKDLDALLETWVGSEESISIFDLSGMPSSILDTLIGILIRILYDSLFWSRNQPEGGRERPLLVVLEEAHTYLGKDSRGIAIDGVRKIVKEGRKYGIGMMLVSQRPSEIDSTILSQCGTLFALRMNNSSDRNHVLGAVSDSFEGLMGMLPTLRTGEAIIIGESVRLPMRTIISPPPFGRRPDSLDPDVTAKWSNNRVQGDYKEVLTLWRQKKVRSQRIVENIKRLPVVNEGEMTDMVREMVTSSNILSIGYEADSMTLEIEFNHGLVYQYYDVPETLHTELLAAESHGKFFNSQIKNNYRFSRI